MSDNPSEPSDVTRQIYERLTHLGAIRTACRNVDWQAEYLVAQGLLEMLCHMIECDCVPGDEMAVSARAIVDAGYSEES